VKVIGLGPDESTLVEGRSNQASPAVGKRWQRALILLAGPGTNLLLALLLQTAVFFFGIRVARYELEAPVIERIDPQSPAAAAGFRMGDRIVAIDGHAVRTWRDVLYSVSLAAHSRLEVEVDRSGAPRTIPVTPTVREGDKYELGYAGFGPQVNFALVVAQVQPGSPAETAGIRAGDVVTRVGGTVIHSSTDLVDAVNRNAPGAVSVEVQRRGETRSFAVVPRKSQGTYLLGVLVRERPVGRNVEEVLEKFPLRRSFVEGWRRVRTDFRMTILVVRRLVSGTASFRQMSGPIDIAKFSGAAAREGPVPLIALMAAISLQLGILNLLPIPVLDGGHLFLLAIEGAARKDFSVRVKERILQLGFGLLVLLMIVVLYNDLAKNLPAKWWPF
jgi:regulator of sigma E protease